MTGQQGAIGDDHVVPDDCIVSHVAMRHEQVVGTDSRGLLNLVRPMDRHMLSNHVVIADGYSGRPAREPHILRQIADHASGVNVIVRADSGMSGEVNVRPQLALPAKNNVAIDDAIWTDPGPLPDSGCGMNNCGRMNHTDAPEGKARSRSNPRIISGGHPHGGLAGSKDAE